MLAHGRKKRIIAYLDREIPSLSETFVVREIAALRELGAHIKIFSLHSPDYSVVHPEFPDLAKEIEVINRPRQALFWLSHIFWIRLAPGRYWTCLWRYVLTSQGNWRSRLRCLTYFAVTPYAAWMMQSQGISHIHAHFANAATTVALMAAELLAITFSFTAHSVYDILFDNLLLPEKLSRANFVVTISNYNRQFLLRANYPEAHKARLEVIHCGIDPESYTVESHLRGEELLILGVGRLVELKGFHDLIAACARLRDRGLAFKCVIIGDGPEADHLRALIIELDLAERVALVGKLQPGEVQQYYRRTDILVMPCCVHNHEHDGIPYVLIEAMAMEIPVISTRLSGIPELVLDLETGLLVNPNDPEALAQAILKLQTNSDLAQHLARAGREWVKREFNVHRNAHKLLKLFEAAMNQPGGTL